MTNKQRTAILKAVTRAKKSEYGVTAVKVELEANLNRNLDEEECHAFIMEQLAELGLAEKREGEWYDDLGCETQWYPKGALSYARFYNDGSVDSEFTFTLMLDKSENILLLPKIIEAFKALAEENGGGMDVRGAGMHMAFLDDPRGLYPSGSSERQRTRQRNYRKSMRLLLPAMYFLGACSEQSRGLSYRRPDISTGTHRAAIDYRDGALEFRLFDTCYDKPDMILDNFVVMVNSLKYWKSTYKSSGVEKIAKSVQFGREGGNDLKRFYVTHTHVDLLNYGLEKLKPSYRSVKELKKQRNFEVNKHQINNAQKEVKKSAQAEYKEYEERFEFSLVANRSRFLADRVSNALYGRRTVGTKQKAREAIKKLEAEADIYAEADKKRKKSLAKYVEDRVKELNQSAGQFTLAAE